MSTSRLFTLAVAVFAGSNVSILPAGPPSPTAPRAPVAVATVERRVPPELELDVEPAPHDVEVEVTPDGHGDHRVVVRRRGFLVSLRNEDARSAGRDWTAMRVSPQRGRGGAAGRLIWETTPLNGLATTRGVVLLTSDGDRVQAALRLAMPPIPAPSWESTHATCRGQQDGLGGFTVLCRFPSTVRVSGAVNVTGARSLDDTWLVPGRSPLVRLDLPRSPGGTEGRVIGMVQGFTGVVLRVEASFVEGDEPALLYGESERAQATAIGF
jgi:hypothetical protein